jgi:hypothetical protein
MGVAMAISSGLLKRMGFQLPALVSRLIGSKAGKVLCSETTSFLHPIYRAVATKTAPKIFNDFMILACF